MKSSTVAYLLPLALLAGMAASTGARATAAAPATSVGPGSGQVTPIDQGFQGRDATYLEHGDGTFENAYAWWSGGQGDPYYGAFAEGYDTGGPVTITGMRLYLTQIGSWDPALTEDLFVWGHGIEGGPGTVLGMIVGASVPAPPIWPGVGAFDFSINATTGGQFYVGCQANWPIEDHVHWFNAVDLDGPAGDPWTCVLPSLNTGCAGWVNTSCVWGGPEDGPARSMGIGVYFLPQAASSVPAPSRRGESTWGHVKALYKR